MSPILTLAKVRPGGAGLSQFGIPDQVREIPSTVQSLFLRDG